MRRAAYPCPDPTSVASTSGPAVARYGGRGAAGLGTLIGGFWLIAWLLGWGAQWSASRFINPKTNLALGVFLAGSALLLLWPKNQSQTRRSAGTVLAALVLLIGALTLSEHLFHFDLGIDQLLATELPGAAATTSPNRMGPPAATSLMLLGIGLLLLSRKRGRVAPYLGLTVILISLVPAVGYLYGIDAFFGKAQLTGIAWPTVVALLSLGVGLVLAETERGPMATLLRDDAGGTLLRRIIPAAVLIPLLLGFAVMQARHRELLERATATGLLVIALVVIFSMLLWRSAAHLSRAAAAEADARQALERERDVLQTTMNGAIHSHLVYLDRDFNFVRVNEAYAKTCGYTPEEMIGKNHFALYPHPENEAIFARVRDTGEAVEFHDKPFVFPGQPERGVTYWEWTLSPVKDEKGSVTGLVFALFETTERKRAEEELARLASFPRLNPYPIVELDLAGCVWFLNPAARGLFPDLEEKRLGHPWLANWDGVVRAVNEGETKIHFRDVTVGDAEYLQAIYSVPETDRIRIYGLDISERKRAERAVERSQKTFSELVERAPFGIYIVDSQFCIAQMNVGSQNGLFRNVRPVIGRDFAEAMRILWPEPIAAEILAHFRHTLETGEHHYSPQFINPRHDVEIVESYEWELHRMTLPDGQYGVICYYFDSTKMRQAEARLSADLAALTRMHALSEKGLGLSGIQPLLQEVMDAAVAIVGADLGTLQLLERESLRIVAHHGHERRFLEFFAAAENQVSVCGEAMHRGERVSVPDVEDSSLFRGTPSLAVLRQAGVRAVQSTPLLSRAGKLLGMLTTQWRVPYTPDEHDLWRIDLLARQAADLIEHSTAERALRDSEERFRALVTATSDVVYRMSPDWSEMRHLEGRKFIADTLEPSRTWLQKYIHPDDQAHVMAVIQEAIRNKSIFQLEHRVLRVDGSLGWTFSRAIPLLDADGEIIEWFGAASDVTARKQAEEDVRASEERFRVAQELSPDGFSILRPVRDPKGRVIDFTWVYANTTTVRFIGTPPQDLAGRSLLALFPGHRGSPLLEAYQQVAETGETRVCEALYEGDGVLSGRWFRTAVVSMGDDIAVLSQDITERKRGEAALRASEERLRQAADLVGLLPYTWEPLTDALHWDARLKALWGLPRDAVVTYEVFLAGVHPEDRAYVEERIARSLDPLGDGSFEAEYRVDGADGVQRWVSARGRTTFSDGKPVIHHGVALNITERKRTQELLIRSEKVAALGRMAAGLAHDINNPLAAVMNTLFLARSNQECAECAHSVRQYLDLADEELRRISHITHQALGFYRGGSTPARVSIRALLDETANIFISKIKSKQAKVEKQYEGDVVEVVGIVGELRQVFSNLFANSLDAISEKGTIKLKVSSFPGRGVQITMADDGKGIEPSAMGRIFEPLFTTKGSLGTGLGLWVTKQLVDKHGGSIRVRSSATGERRGTTFSVFLPSPAAPVRSEAMNP